MTINLNEINQRYNLIGRRLAAIEKESALLKKEQESLHILMELYHDNQGYYDIIKEEANITTALSPDNKPLTNRERQLLGVPNNIPMGTRMPSSSTPPKSKRPYNTVDTELILLILETPRTATQVAKEYGNVASSTIRDTLLRLVRQGTVTRKPDKTYVRTKEE